MTCKHPDRRRFICRLPWLMSLYGALAGVTTASAAKPQKADPQRTANLALLRRVERWGCQYLNIDLDQIAASDLDMIILEPVLDGGTKRYASAAEIERLKQKPSGGRRLVIGYLSVGEAAQHRDYWHDEWRTAPPPWLGAGNPNWPGSYLVRYWRREWQEIILDHERGLLGQLLAAGFDGAFLDRVDAYDDWTSERLTAQPDMIDLVERVGRQARVTRPGFLLIGQNSEPLLRVPRYRRSIDAVSKERLFYSLRVEDAANPPDDVAWSRLGLDAARLDGLPVLGIEYVTAPRAVAEAKRKLRELRFVPFIANPALDRLPGTWPPPASGLPVVVTP